MQQIEHICAWLNQQYGNGRQIAKFDLANAESLPREGGAYLLLFDIQDALKLSLKNRPSMSLFPGLYVYAGSANGPGGLRARVGRHLKGAEKPHWHIDHVTSTCPPICAFVVPYATECALAEGIRANFAATFPIPGFGASDCRECDSHFLALPEMDADKKSD